MTARERLRQAADWIDPARTHRQYKADDLATFLRTLADRLDAEEATYAEQLAESDPVGSDEACTFARAEEATILLARLDAPPGP